MMKHGGAVKSNRGVTLIETIVFLVIVSVALVALLRVYNRAVIESVDPLVRTRALELAQAQLDEVLSRKFAENTPSGGIPACSTTGAPTCITAVADTADGELDDVGDYNGFTVNHGTDFDVSVAVVDAGGEIGLPAAQARRITVTVTMPRGDRAAPDSVVLSAYKANF